MANPRKKKGRPKLAGIAAAVVLILSATGCADIAAVVEGVVF
jgi:hypothetical protein